MEGECLQRRVNGFWTGVFDRSTIADSIVDNDEL